jgi:hypothetical protein
MPNNKVFTAGAVAVVIVIGAIGFAIGQRSTSYNLFGLSGTCIDTTIRH